MRRAFIGLLSAILVLSGCVSAPAPSDPHAVAASAGASPSAPPSPSPSPAPSDAPSSHGPSSEPTTDPSSGPVPFPTDATPAGVPAAFADTAWAGMQMDRPEAVPRIGHLFAGPIGSAPTIQATITNPVGYPNPVTAGGRVAVVEARGARAARIRVWDATAGLEVADLDVGSLGNGVVLDPERPFVYTAELRPAGGVDIRRRSLAGDVDDLLISLDKRFTPDAIPTERYGMVLDPDGVLVVEACGNADGCRLWEVPPNVAPAPRPRTLPGTPPLVCSVIAASRDWVVVHDDDACWVDTSDGPLPVRAIRRSDGVSHVVTDDHVGIGRVVELGGRTWLVGANPVFAGSDVALVRYDIVTGARDVLVPSLPAAANEQTYAVSPAVLPGSWVLLEPWFVENGSIPVLIGRLIDLGTGEAIELPIGTFGWS